MSASDHIPPGEIRSKLQGLIGNPDVVKKTKQERHKYYKRPGKGHNRDNCDACGDVGDILCCDDCPASFHILCLDPPMEAEDLPAGGWQCNACRFKRKGRYQTVGYRLRRTNPVLRLDLESRSVLRAFRVMITAAMKQNPKEYQPPPCIPTYEHFLPGAERPDKNKLELKKKEFGVVEVDKKTGKLRAVVCYNCEIGSRVGAMIRCDFCPEYFHLDCLEPPMTIVPSVVWMCPLHPQPLMESKFLEASSVTERLRVHDMSNQPMDPSRTTLDFMKKTHSSGPVKAFEFDKKPRYKTPFFISGRYEEFRVPVENAPKAINFKTTLPECGVSKLPPTSRVVAKPDPNEASAQEQEKAPRSELLPMDQIVVKPDPDEVPSAQEQGTSAGVELPPAPQGPQIETKPDPDLVYLAQKQKTSPGLELLLEAVEIKLQGDVLDNCLKFLHPEMVKLLAAQKLAESPKMSAAFIGRSQASCALPPPMAPPRQGVRRDEVEAGPSTGTKRKRGTFLPPPQPKEVYLTPSITLVHLNDGAILEFQRRSIEIGTGAGVGLDLSKLGSCGAISPRHVSIYYDQTTGRWELLNYGESGTFVNGIFHGLDTSRFDAKPKVEDEAARLFQDIVLTRRKNIMANKNPKVHPSGIHTKQGVCKCCSSGERVRPTQCWEGNAIIQKRDTIQIGCHKFVVVNTGHVEKVGSPGLHTMD